MKTLTHSRPPRRILLAGGGTGGHIYPGLAIIEALRRQSADVEIFFARTHRQIDGRILGGVDGINVVMQPVLGMSGGPLGCARSAVSLLKGYRQMKRFISDERIDVVFGFGGFGSSAAMAAAGNLGVRCGVLNPDAVPGKANRLFARWADDVFVQWAMTGKYFKRPVHVVGCPVRQRIKNLAGEERDNLRETALRKFDLNGRMRTVFVMGGSTGARSVNRAVVKTLDGLADDVQVLHMTGHNDFEYVKGEYSKSTRRRHRVVEYIERVDLALAAADLVVARAGAVALAELIAAGVPSILMPYPYDRQKHQRANAQVLVEAGGAVMVDDDGEAGDRTVGALADALADILGDERRLSEMSEVLKRLTRRDADEEIARWLLTT